MEDILIRQLKKEEFQTALNLVWEVFKEFVAPDYSQEGVEEFYKSVHDLKYLEMLKIYGAFIGDKLVGVVATRNEGSHLALFFVDGAYHRKGIGRKLFQETVSKCHSEKMTVNSSPYAVPFYHEFGFSDLDAEQIVHGIRFTPMEYKK